MKKNLNNTNNNGLDIEIIDNGNNEAYTNGKGNTSDELTVSVADAINVKQTIKDSLVKAGIAATVVVGVSALVAVAPGLATFFTIAGLTLGTAYICNVVGTMYDLFTRDYSSPDECRLAWGEFTSHMISDGAGLFVGSLVNKYLSPIIESKINEVKNKTAISIKNTKINVDKNIYEHMNEGSYIAGKKVSGCHNRDNFYKLVADNKVQIVSENELPNLKGIYYIQYHIAKTDMSGGFKAYTFEKTVFDPKLWSCDKFVNMGIEAAENNIIINKITGDGTFACTYKNVKFEYTIRDGELKTVYPLY